MQKVTTIVLLILSVTFSYAQKKKATPYIINYEMSPKESIAFPVKFYRPLILTPDYRDKFDEYQQSDEPKEFPKGSFFNMAAKYLKIEGTGHPIVVNEEAYIIALNIPDITITKYLEPGDKHLEYNFDAKVVVLTPGGSVLWSRPLDTEYTSGKVSSMFVKYDQNRSNQKMDAQLYIKEHQEEILEKMLMVSQKYLLEDLSKLRYSSNLGMFDVKGKGYDEVNSIAEEFMVAYRGFNAISEKKKLSEEDLGEVYKKGIAIWEKAISEKAAELEPEALTGLKLNCAVAYTWLGEYDQAKTYLEQVDGKFEPVGGAAYTEEWALGAAMMNLTAYTNEAMELYLNFSTAKDRITINH